MKTSKLKKEKIVIVPAILLWAVGKKAELAGNLHELEKVLSLFNSSLINRKKESWRNRDEEQYFLSIIKKHIGKGIIPFERNKLDLNLAATLYVDLKEFRIRSNNSYVGPGFLRVGKDKINYVNFLQEMILYESKNTDFFEDENKSLLLNYLDEFSSKSFSYETVNSGGTLLKITGKTDSFTRFSEESDCSISLWNGPIKSDEGLTTRSSSLNRRLGLAKIEVVGTSELFLTNLSAQSQLEMTAASMVDQWLLIESENLNIFGQLPYLTDENSIRKVAIHDPNPLSKFLLDQTPKVYIEKSSAVFFAKKYSWFVPNDSQTWLEAIT